MAPTELTDWLESKTSKLTWLFQPFMISIRNRYMRPDPTFSPVSWLPASPVFLTSRQHIFYKTHLSQPFQRHSFITVPTLFRFSLDREASFFYYFLFAARLSWFPSPFFYYQSFGRGRRWEIRVFEIWIKREMAVSRVSFGEVVAVAAAALVSAIFLPATYVQASGPAPAPTSDG